MRVVFWQDYLNLHQSAAIRALATNQDCEVILAVGEELPAARLAMGFAIPEYGNASVYVQPSDNVVKSLIQNRPEDSIHIFFGIRGFAFVRKAFGYCYSTTARMAVMSEAGDHRGTKGVLRRVLGKIDYYRFGCRIEFILALGSIGVRWFSQCGYPAAKIYPYAYCVSPSSTSQLSRQQNKKTEPFRLLYLGQLVPRKGLDFLLHALHTLRNENWTLTLIGDGSARNDLQRMSRRLLLSERMDFLPSKSNKLAVEALGNADLLVLPSRFDGWGAVVNEALMQGVPVICSDNCGAADLLRDDWRGEVFKSFSASSLRQSLKRRLELGKPTEESRQRIVEWSSCITGDAVAKYLKSVINASTQRDSVPRPTPPWHSFETKSIVTGMTYSANK